MSDDDVKAMQAKLAALEATVAALTKPQAPVGPRPAAYDPTARFGMPAEVVAEMVKAVPDRAVADVVGDHRRGVADKAPEPRTVPSANGWVEARPLPAAPSGYQHIERMMDAADAAERRRRGGGE